MGKFKIQKGLSDADMLKNIVEEDNFETIMLEKESIRNKPKFHQSLAQTQESFYQEFLTDKIKTQIGKLLLDIKMEYFREGEGDFSIQVKRNGKHILLETAPKKVK